MTKHTPAKKRNATDLTRRNLLAAVVLVVLLLVRVIQGRGV